MYTRCRQTVALLLLAATLTILAGCDEPRANAPELLDEAREHMAEGKVREAHITLLNALQADKELTAARHLLARTSLELGDFARAEKEIRGAMEQDVSRREGLPVLARALLRQGKHEAALKETEELPESRNDTERAELLALRGQAALNLRDIATAEDTLRRALDLEPGQIDARVGMAMLAGLRRNAGEAREWLEPVLKRTPVVADAWSTLGDIELQTDNLGAAIDAFSKAIESRPYPTLDRAKRALARFLTDDDEAARKDLAALRRAGVGEHPYVNYVRGVGEFRAGNFAEALTALQRSAADAPDLLSTKIYLAATHLRLGNTEQALRAARSVYRAAPDSLLGASLLTRIHLSRSELAAAEEILREALAANPDVPALLGTMSNVALLRGNTAEAVSFAERLMEQRPDSMSARNLVLMARLLDGSPLDGSLVESPVAGEEDEQARYVADFLAALGAFRDGRIDEARSAAMRLRERHPERPDPAKLLAAVQLRTGQWDSARETLGEVLELTPDDTNVRFSLAKVERGLGNEQRAYELSTEALADEPGNEQMALFAADLATALDNEAEGRTVLEKALRANPDAARVRARLAADYLAQRRLDQVIELTSDLSSAWEREAPELLEIRGQAFLLSGDPGSARTAFARLAELRPDDARARFVHAETLARTGKLDQARVELAAALELDPDLLDARIGQVKLLVRDGEIEKARNKLDELTEAFGDRPEVSGVKGWFALGTGAYAEAEDHLARALEAAPGSDLVVLLVQALWAQGKHEQAIARMKAWLEDNPQDATVLMHLAGAYLTLGRSADARETYQQVVANYPDHVPALNNLAWLTRDTDPKRALDLARRAHELEPRDPNVLDTLGELLLRDGQVDVAHRRLTEARRLAPNDRGIQVNLARALLAQDREAEAEKLLQTVVDQGGGNDDAGREAQELLARLRGPE